MIYERALIEKLLPTLWDSSYAYGIANELAPPPDMPKGYSDPSKGCTLFAHLGDIKSAWRHSGLTFLERRALLLRYGFDWTHEAVGVAEGIKRQSAQARIDSGLGRLVAYLNGHEAEGESAQDDPGSRLGS